MEGVFNYGNQGVNSKDSPKFTTCPICGKLNIWENYNPTTPSQLEKLTEFLSKKNFSYSLTKQIITEPTPQQNENFEKIKNFTELGKKRIREIEIKQERKKKTNPKK